MTAQHRLLPGNQWDVTVSDFARQIEEDRNRTQPRSWTIPAELGRWLALRRIRRGGVAFHAPAAFTDGGYRILDYLVPYLLELVDQGYARVDEQKVRITSSGEALFVALEPAHRLRIADRRNGPHATERCDRGMAHESAR